MKKNLLFTAIILALFSCNNNDNSSIEPQNPNENETTMKLKEFRALATSKYFYHENGFVDSISTSRAGNIPTEIQTKLHYNSENKLISMERWVDVSNETIYENDIFEYNNENLIITKKVYDQNQNLKQNFNYTYDSDGYLNNSNLTYIEGNLVQDGSFTYSYDNKNNQTSTNKATETLENINWSYNQNGYPVSFQKSPVLPDDIDFAEYIYY